MHGQRNIKLFHDVLTPSGPGPPHCRGFTITDTPHSLGLFWTSDQLDAGTSTLKNSNNRLTSMPPKEFEPALPERERPQTQAFRLRGHWDPSLTYTTK